MTINRHFIEVNLTVIRPDNSEKPILYTSFGSKVKSLQEFLVKLSSAMYRRYKFEILEAQTLKILSSFDTFSFDGIYQEFDGSLYDYCLVGGRNNSMILEFENNQILIIRMNKWQQWNSLSAVGEKPRPNPVNMMFGAYFTKELKSLNSQELSAIEAEIVSKLPNYSDMFVKVGQVWKVTIKREFLKAVFPNSYRKLNSKQTKEFAAKETAKLQAHKNDLERERQIGIYCLAVKDLPTSTQKIFFERSIPEYMANEIKNRLGIRW